MLLYLLAGTDRDSLRDPANCNILKQRYHKMEGYLKHSYLGLFEWSFKVKESAALAVCQGSWCFVVPCYFTERVSVSARETPITKSLKCLPDVFGYCSTYCLKKLHSSMVYTA